MKKNHNPRNITAYQEHMDGPVLDTIKVCPITKDETYPFCLPLIANLTNINFASQVTFFVGENGTGKSTILEAIAHKAGFSPEGGSKNFAFKTAHEKTFSGAQKLAEHFTLSWRKKPRNGYFFKAESFFNVATYLDELALTGGGPETTFAPYGGKSLHAQSHGESFLSFFSHRLGNEGFFIFDEPEAALSPARQLSLLVIMQELCKNKNVQFIIATHSPLLLAFPNATIYSCDGNELTTISYKDTMHYQITKDFLDDPSRYMHHLFNE